MNIEQLAQERFDYIMGVVAKQGGSPTVIPIVHWQSENDYNAVYSDADEMPYEIHCQMFDRIAELLSEAGQMPYICTGTAEIYFRWLERVELANTPQTRAMYSNVLFQLEREKK